MSKIQSTWGVKQSTQCEIEHLLEHLDIVFHSSGQVSGALQFASLRAPCANGIYYLEGDAIIPESVTGSLIICRTDRVPSTKSNATLCVASPKLAFYKLMRAVYKPTPCIGGIHPTALVDPGACVANDAFIGPFCLVEAGATIRQKCILDSHIVIKSGSIIEDGTHIEPHCTIGATGIAWAWDGDSAKRVIQPQVGGVRIGHDVFVGSDVAIVRGSVNEVTDVGDGSVIAHGSKIGHGCRLGSQVHLANNVSLAGNVDIGDRAFLGSGAVVRPHIRLADGVVVGAGAVVTRSIHTKNAVVSGVPARIMPTHKRSLSGVPDKPSQQEPT